MNPHLLAAVPFSTGENPNCLSIETRLFCEMREYEVHRNLFSVVLNIVIDHYDVSAWRKDTRQLVYDKAHFEEVVFNHQRDVRVVQLVLVSQTVKNPQDFLECPLARKNLKRGIKSVLLISLAV
jgi:hypothetical protein